MALFSEHSFFIIALSFMLMHEMDAIRCKEWQIFPGLSLLKDEIGFIVFMLLHLPLYYLLLLPLLNENKEALIFGLNGFFIIHLFLHLLLLRHAKNAFKDWISWVIISGAAIFSTLDLIF